jgi:hypothetical protein
MSDAPKPTISFRHSAGFGRRIEYWIIGKMLKEGLDVYVPVVDDFGIDAVIRWFHAHSTVIFQREETRIPQGVPDR